VFVAFWGVTPGSFFYVSTDVSEKSAVVFFRIDYPEDGSNTFFLKCWHFPPEYSVKILDEENLDTAVSKSDSFCFRIQRNKTTGKIMLCRIFRLSIIVCCDYKFLSSGIVA